MRKKATDLGAAVGSVLGGGEAVEVPGRREAVVEAGGKGAVLHPREHQHRRRPAAPLGGTRSGPGLEEWVRSLFGN